MLTLDNSVVRVSKKSKTVNCITEIEQWTTTFPMYMSILTQKFPWRSQELLQYMSLIRYAAWVHKGLGWQKWGWAIYDYKFGQKASRNHTSVWSDVDHQLWLTIFTVTPSVLKGEYSIFAKGPQPNSVSTRGEQWGICHAYNRTGQCNRATCNHRHVCS